MYTKEEYIGYGTNELPKLSDEELKKELQRVEKELEEFNEELNSSDKEFPVYVIKENIKNAEYEIERIKNEIANRANNAKLHNGINNNTATEDVGTMLPQVGLDGQAIESVKAFASRVVERPVVSAKLTRLITAIYTARQQLYIASKTNSNKDKIDKIKLNLAKNEKELENVKRNASPKIQEEIKKIEANLNKNTRFYNINEKAGSTMSKLIIESEDKKEVPSDLKRLDEIRASIDSLEKQIGSLKEDLKKAQSKFDKSGEKSDENRVKGITAKIDTVTNKKKDKEEELSKKEKQLKKEEAKIKQESAIYESADMEDEIRPIVEELNRKGYSVKYASPGHTKLRKKEDKEPDGVYYGKLYSDARIMFKDAYSFPEAPKYWHWREVDGCSYLDISPISYSSKDGSPDEAFRKWKENYMNSLRTYVDNLKSNGSSKKSDNDSEDESDKDEVQESVDEFAANMVDAIYENLNAEEVFTKEEAVNESVNEPVDKTEVLLHELEDLLS